MMATFIVVIFVNIVIWRFTFNNYVKLRYMQLSLGNRVAAFWERVGPFWSRC